MRHWVSSTWLGAWHRVGIWQAFFPCPLWPFSCWTTQDGEQRQRWLWSVIILSHLFLLQKHRGRILKGKCILLNNLSINLGCHQLWPRHQLRCPILHPSDVPAYFTFGFGSVGLTYRSENSRIHSPLGLQQIMVLLSSVVSSPNVVISGRFSSLCIFNILSS